MLLILCFVFKLNMQIKAGKSYSIQLGLFTSCIIPCQRSFYSVCGLFNSEYWSKALRFMLRSCQMSEKGSRVTDIIIYKTINTF